MSDTKNELREMKPSTKDEAIKKLIQEVKLIANCGSVEDFTVASIRCTLRDALYRYNQVSDQPSREVVEECCKAVCFRCNRDEPVIYRDDRLRWIHKDGDVIELCRAMAIREHFKVELL